MVTLKSEKEIAILREAGQKLGNILQELKAMVRPGLSTQYFEEESRRLIKESGAEPLFLGYKPAGATVPYPAALCIGLNDAVVHTPPDKDCMIKAGDVVKLDLGLRYQGWCVDSAVTVLVPPIDKKVGQLIDATALALEEGIKMAVPGNTLGDIGSVIEKTVRAHGFSVVRDLTGHGIGKKLHEEPSVFNFGEPGKGMVLKSGMVIAIEPITAMGNGRIRQVSDDSYVTADHSLAAHFEHTVAITDHGPEVLTAIS
ncbi:MAG: type I methionyl aminopeptidase [Patescibacteria group bacterium]